MKKFYWKFSKDFFASFPVGEDILFLQDGNEQKKVIVLFLLLVNPWFFTQKDCFLWTHRTNNLIPYHPHCLEQQLPFRCIRVVPVVANELPEYFASTSKWPFDSLWFPVAYFHITSITWTIVVWRFFVTFWRSYYVSTDKLFIFSELSG